MGYSGPTEYAVSESTSRRADVTVPFYHKRPNATTNPRIYYQMLTCPP